MWRRLYVWMIFNKALLAIAAVPAYPYRWLIYSARKLTFFHDCSATPEELRNLWP